MGLRDRLKRLRERAEGPEVIVPQQDGTVKKFAERELGPAFVDALDRELGRKGLRSDPEEPEHPLCAAARNSSDPEWSNSLYVTDRPEKPIEDLSE